MPHPTWKHRCSALGGVVWSGSPTCSSCGELGEYDGWHFGRIEAMGSYQQRTGMKPIGEHRSLTDMLLGPLLRECGECKGRGLVCLGEDRWQRCPQCDGAMSVRCVSDQEFEETQRRILLEYPDAALDSTVD